MSWMGLLCCVGGLIFAGYIAGHHIGYREGKAAGFRQGHAAAGRLFWKGEDS